ncbi:MAG: argininosuccinate lyase [Verrucomicrobiales bacterium]|nr:argininosuccinate lyase [Verrucomicrobiales bacterium]
MDSHSPQSQTFSDTYGADGRLSQSAADALVASAYRHDCADADVLLEGVSLADLAHALALIECGAIPATVAPRLLRGLLELHAIPIAEFPIRPELGDVYNSREALLKERIGHDSGWLHAGRPRREAVNIGYLIAVRDRIARLMQSHAALGFAFTDRAEEHIGTLMPDFTYLHHAHPTSLGHYLLTYAQPMRRDLDRLSAVHARVNASPAGSGSVNGTRLPIDRARLASRLGFSSVAIHTRDAMWQPDVPIECISAAVTLMVNLDRFAEELQIWGTAEFDFADLPDSLSRSSVIMPQKKNPYPLAYIRGLTGHLLGKTASFAAVGKTFSGNPDSRVFIYGELPRSLDRVAEAVNLFAAVITGFTPHLPRMRRGLDEGYPEATDLADHLMLAQEMDYRTAHHLVGRAIRLAIDESHAGPLTGAHLDRAADALGIGRPGLTDDALATITAPDSIVASREGIGGAAPDRVRDMIADARSHFDAARHEAARLLTQTASSKAELLAEATRLSQS